MSSLFIILEGMFLEELVATSKIRFSSFFFFFLVTIICSHLSDFPKIACVHLTSLQKGSRCCRFLAFGKSEFRPHFPDFLLAPRVTTISLVPQFRVRELRRFHSLLSAPLPTTRDDLSLCQCSEILSLLHPVSREMHSAERGKLSEIPSPSQGLG